MGKVFINTLHEPVERRPVCDIDSLCFTSSACEDAADTSLVVKDDAAGMAGSGECAALVVRKEWLLHGRPVRAVLEVLAHKGHSADSVASSHAGGATTLDDDEARLVV